MSKEKRSNEKGSKKIGIKWKMFAILLVFTTAVIGVIWFFQVVMLDVFYRNTKFRELEYTADRLEVMAGDLDIMEQFVYDSTAEYDSSIAVFKVVDGVAVAVIEAGQPTNNIMPFFSRADMQELYDRATKNGGSYVATASHKFLEDGAYGKFVIEFDKYDISKKHFSDFSTKSAVDVRIFEDENQYIIIQTADLSPVTATVKTLNEQFVWIGIILAILALALAGIMSKLITKPIIKMNDAAQKLALRRYNADFEGEGYREIFELSQTLNYASCELAKTDKFQKELISNVSHDLRTPLTMIKGYAEVIRDIPDESTPENIQVIIDETERLAELVNDMLDVSKLQAGTRAPNMQIFSLTQAIGDLMQRYEKLTEQDGYKIDFTSDAEAFVCADSVMIMQVIYNLINNAINYTGEDRSVTVKQNINGNKVRISVTDTGEGISKEDLPLIWDRYYKVDKVHKRATIGTGLGLSIAREVLDLHNAQFGVSTKLGEGSTFWFELDIVQNGSYGE